MESTKPAARPLLRTTLLATALMVSHASGQPGGLSASRETTRRSGSVEQARELLAQGDGFYTTGKFAEATDFYAKAHERLPKAPLTFALREAAAERYAQAAVEHAKDLSRKGHVQAAKDLIDKVLEPDVAPANHGALTLRNQLDDPIRTNPALTPEHARDVDEVRRLLYIAQGAHDLGKFDESKATYEKVLKIDPTNSAASRGMEKVNSAITAYQKSAFDHTRSEMLNDVAKQWETQPPPVDEITGLAARGLTEGQTIEATLSSKLDQIILPRVAFEGATLYEAVDYLRAQVRNSDASINFTINPGPTDSPEAKQMAEHKFTLQLGAVPVSGVLKYITELTKTAYTVDDFSVIITPAGYTSDELVSRTFRVPPDFLTAINEGTGGAEAPGADDPFATNAEEKKGLLTERLSARQALEKHGVKFPDGSLANYNAATNTLRIVNTATNLDFVTRILDTMTKAEPVTVAVSVTMIKTEKTNLDELGFDWLVSPFGASANHMFAAGGTTGNGSARTGADFISPISGTAIESVPADPSTPAQGVITSGNRTGDFAITQNSIDGLINNQDRGSQVASAAPGIFGVTGLFTDGQVQALMRGLAQKKNVDLMARPSVTTRSGQASSINITRSFIYPTEYEPPELPNTVNPNTSFGIDGSISSSSGGFPITPATPTAFETREVGVSLEVLPVVDANKQFVDVTLNPSFSDFDGFVNYGSPINSTSSNALGLSTTVQLTANRILMPIFSTQKASTQLTIADGATVVIGGLLKDEIQTVEDKTPVLGDLPVVGRLFQTKARQKRSTAIIFLVNVKVMDPTGRPYRN